jgi:hypothetical protein
MANQYTCTNPITKEQMIKDYYGNVMTQVELAEKYNTTPKVVERLFKTYGLKARVAAKRNQLGSNNLQWNGGKYIDGAGYVVIKRRNHPRANTRGYVKEHILIMEKHIGRQLEWFGAHHPESEIVHHINENRQDNRIDNLKLMRTKEHWEIHADNFYKNQSGNGVHAQ